MKCRSSKLKPWRDMCSPELADLKHLLSSRSDTPEHLRVVSYQKNLEALVLASENQVSRKQSFQQGRRS